MSSAALVPWTDTECSPSEKPAGNFVTQASAPWLAGGNAQVVVSSVPVTPYTLARPVGSPAAGLGAVIEHVLAYGVERVEASIDPANIASARLLDRLGFSLCRRGTAVVRGETVDDDRYVLLPSAATPADPPPVIRSAPQTQSSVEKPS